MRDYHGWQDRFSHRSCFYSSASYSISVYFSSFRNVSYLCTICDFGSLSMLSVLHIEWFAFFPFFTLRILLISTLPYFVVLTLLFGYFWIPCLFVCQNSLWFFLISIYFVIDNYYATLHNSFYMKNTVWWTNE